MIHVDQHWSALEFPCPFPASRILSFSLHYLCESVCHLCPWLGILLVSWLSVPSVKNQGLGGPKELENNWVLTLLRTADSWSVGVSAAQIVVDWYNWYIYCKWSKSNCIMKHERSPLLVHISKSSCWDTLTVRGDRIYFNTWAARAGWENLSAVAEYGIPRSAHGFSLLRDLFSGKVSD